MKQPIAVVYRGVAPQPLLEADVQRWHQKLHRCGIQPVDCRVTVESPSARHQQNGYEVRIELRLPGDDLVISEHHHGDEVRPVARRAFAALNRQLRERVKRWRDVRA
jgi:hypothetical protein